MATWTHLYTYRTWTEFLEAGGHITGFPERRWNTVQQLAAGDVLLCYLMGISRYVGILDVIGDPFIGYKPIWTDRVFAARVPVAVRMALLPEYGVPVLSLRHELSYFQNLTTPRAWTAHFRSAPVAETPDDGEVIINALEIAGDDPTYRDFDPRKLARDVKLYESAVGVFTVPEYDTSEETSAEGEDSPNDELPITHEEIQWLLLMTGSAMGLDVWVARNDRGRHFQDNAFQDIPLLLDELPRQFDPATQRTIELIDVLWLKEGAILAAFEIEHTSAVYSGLLRMADLIAMQPNLHIRLYIVAPDERRDKVFAEINRPTFSRLKLPLSQLCHYLPYSALKNKLSQVETVLRYLQPEFLNEIAEGIEAEV